MVDDGLQLGVDLEPRVAAGTEQLEVHEEVYVKSPRVQRPATARAFEADALPASLFVGPAGVAAGREQAVETPRLENLGRSGGVTSS